MIKYAILAVTACAFMSACQPETKVYNYKIKQTPTVKKTPTYRSSPSKVGGGGYRYEGSRDSSSGFRASQ